MNRQFIGLLVAFICVLSCASNEAKNEPKIRMQDVSSEIDNAIISASEIIIEKLPANSTVALFNTSSDENELTNYVIEEISSILINKGNLKVVERSRIEILEKEHNWQMDTGYVPDEEVTSIVEKLGAQYIVSCYITGNTYLQRLRIKTWNLRTGETIASSVYPVNFIGEQLVQANNENVTVSNDNNENNYILTVRENGVTIDYGTFNDILNGDNRKYMNFEVYIDGTMDYFNIEYISSENNNTFMYMLRTWNIKSVNDITTPETAFSKWEKTSSSFNFNLYVTPMITDNITENLSKYGVDRRNINTIVRIITREINKHN